MLTSSGLVTSELVDACEKLCGKPREDISVAIINEASKVEVGDKRWVARHFNDLSQFFGGILDIVDLQALEKEESACKIDATDMIYVLGGDTDYLMDVYVKSGFDEILRERLSRHVYVGCSAGAMVLGTKTQNSVYDNLYAERRRVEVDEYMNLIDYVLFPHKDDEKFPQVTEENIRAHFDVNKNFFAMQREQAVIINEDDISFVGGHVFGHDDVR